MDTGCVEIVVTRKEDTLLKVGCIAAAAVAVCFFILIFMFGIVFLFLAAAAGLVSWFLWLQNGPDYEYAYVDKELRIAKILRKSSRKEIGTYDLSSLEIMAPSASRTLDHRRAAAHKVLDYSADPKEGPGVKGRYSIFLEDGTEIILDLNDPYGQGDIILRSVRAFAPRKVEREI